MTIIFLVPTPPPVLATADAYVQEIHSLRQHFGGEIFYINPNRFLPRHLPLQLPRPVFGLHCLPRLRTSARRHRVVQILSPTLYAYPVLSMLGRPVVYQLTGGAGSQTPPLSFFERLAAVTVPDTRSLEHLRAAGLKNVHRVRAGIETGRFRPRHLALGEELHLLMASAPWTTEQFRSKGVDALLDAAVAEPRLRLTLLWRGILTEQVERRIGARGLGARVEVIDRLVDVDEVLAKVHATINLAERGDIVKAYPHSLLESLAAGKPVLVSRAIPMAQDVAASGCGVVVERVASNSILDALRDLEVSYERFQRAAVVASSDYRLERMVDSFAKVYATIPGFWAAAVGAQPSSME